MQHRRRVHTDELDALEPSVSYPVHRASDQGTRRMNDDYCRGLQRAMTLIEQQIQVHVGRDSEYDNAICFHLWNVQRQIAEEERKLTTELYAVSKVPGHVWYVYRGVGDNTDQD